MALVAFGPDKQELWTWTWPTPALAQRVATAAVEAEGSATPRVENAGGEIRLVAGEVSASFDAATGLLRRLSRGASATALTNGPLLTFARPESAGAPQWLSFAAEDAATQTRRLAKPELANTLQIELDYPRTVAWAGFRLEISPDGESWRTIYDATRRSGDGRSYNFPPQPVAAVRLSNLRRSDGQPVTVRSVRLGYAAARFPANPAGGGTVTTGSGTDAGTQRAAAWIEARGTAGLERFRWTLLGNGALRLDYEYKLDGEALYHGITFTHPEDRMKSVRWLGEGRYRVWQNRLRGVTLGVHQIARNDLQPGETFEYPEFQGVFGGLRWGRLETTTGPLTFTSGSPELYLRIGTPRISHQNTTVDFPAGDLSFLHAIPAIGSKFVTPERSGPASLPARASGTYRGSVTFSVRE